HGERHLLRAGAAGAQKVALAVTASTLTTVVVFLPLIFLDRGEIRVYMEDSGAAINLSLLASLAIALTFIPLVSSRILRGGNIHRSATIERVGRAYGRLLALCLRRRLPVMILLALALAATYYFPVKSLGAQAQAEDNDRQIKVKLEVSGDYNLDKAEEYLLAFEEVLEKHREELDVEHLYVQSRSNEGAIHLFLEKQHAPTEALKERVRALIPEFRGGGFRIVQDDWSSRPETTTLSLRITGEDADVLREYAVLLGSRLQGVEGIRDVILETGRGKQELRIVVDRTLAAAQGIAPATVAQTIAFAFRGRDLPKIQEREREVDVFIQLREEDRRTVQDLRRITLPNLAGRPVPLGAVARFEEAPGYHSIDRSHGKRFLKIVLESDKETITKVRERVSDILDDFRLPTGYQVSYGDAFVTLGENQSAFKEAMLMSLILIYLLLGAMFESFLLPITILMSVPLAFMGSYWLMYLVGTPMDYSAYIGLIILVGIVVKNAIVIVDRIEGREREGMGGAEAIVTASMDRFRPVLMTALTTILGLLPLAFGTQSMGSLQFYPMGRVVMGGMVSSTFLTLFVIPVAYSLTRELGAALRSALPRLRPRPRAETHYYT
ncbi:MAG: efflux RND transporter permease subunit, partial [Candidatus Methylomirabilis sp.]|nr:efflux RND transporter permease subunit [Deltaproteobacteria bacterium]